MTDETYPLADGGGDADGYPALPDHAYQNPDRRRALVDNSDEDVSDDLAVAERVLRWLVRLQVLFVLTSWCGCGLLQGLVPPAWAVMLTPKQMSLLFSAGPGVALFLLAALGMLVTESNRSRRWFFGPALLGLGWAVVSTAVMLAI